MHTREKIKIVFLKMTKKKVIQKESLVSPDFQNEMFFCF